VLATPSLGVRDLIAAARYFGTRARRFVRSARAYVAQRPEGPAPAQLREGRSRVIVELNGYGWRQHRPSPFPVQAVATIGRSSLERLAK
jgi:hypothetical protein